MSPLLARAASVLALALLAGPLTAPAEAQAPDASPDPAALADPPAAVDTVRLTFAWPLGAAAQVRTFQSESKAGGGTDSEMLLEGVYSLSVESHREGLLLRHTDATTLRYEQEPAQPLMEELFGRIGSLTPHYVVSTGGELIDVEGVGELAAELTATLDPLLDSLPTEAAGVRQLLQRLTSTEYLLGAFQEQWNSMVGQWIGAEFELGALYEMTDEAPSPLIPDRTIPFQYYFAISERTSCADGHAPDSCVVLEFESFPDPAGLASLLTEVVGEMNLGEGTLDTVEQYTFVTVVAEPGTLLPWRWEMARELRVTGSENGEPMEVTEVEEQAVTFAWKRGASPQR